MRAKPAPLSPTINRERLVPVLEAIAIRAVVNAPTIQPFDTLPSAHATENLSQMGLCQLRGPRATLRSGTVRVPTYPWHGGDHHRTRERASRANPRPHAAHLTQSDLRTMARSMIRMISSYRSRQISWRCGRSRRGSTAQRTTTLRCLIRRLNSKPVAEQCPLLGG